jgi:hypothetical protein
VKLTQPFCDAIHQLEQDRPLLSKLAPVWDKLVKHCEAWAEQAGDSLAKHVVKEVKDRRSKHYEPEWAAAYLVDPANAIALGTASSSGRTTLHVIVLPGFSWGQLSSLVRS